MGPPSQRKIRYWRCVSLIFQFFVSSGFSKPPFSLLFALASRILSLISRVVVSWLFLASFQILWQQQDLSRDVVDVSGVLLSLSSVCCKSILLQTWVSACFVMAGFACHGLSDKTWLTLFSREIFPPRVDLTRATFQWNGPLKCRRTMASFRVPAWDVRIIQRRYERSRESTRWLHIHGA